MFRVAGVRNQTGEPDTMPSENTVHIAIELSFSSWLVAARLTGAKKSRLHRIEGGDTGALLALIAELRSRALTQLGGAAEVACCFEAGRDGFWLHRLLTAHGILVYVLEPTSILVNRRSRRAKTDRLDAEGMLRVLAAWLGGDRQVCSMVRVPTARDRTASASASCRRSCASRTGSRHCCSRKASEQGRRCARGSVSWRTGDGRTLPPLLRAELDRLRRRHPGADPRAGSRARRRAGRSAGRSHGPEDHLPSARPRHRRQLLCRARARGALPFLRKPPSACQLCRRCPHALPERRHGPRPEHQPRRQSAGTYHPYPARLAVAALPAWQRARYLVPRARWHAAGAHAADRHRCAGKKVADRAVALRGSRSAAGGRRDQDRNGAGGVKRTGLLQA